MIDRTRKRMLVLLAAAGTICMVAVGLSWIGRSTGDLAARTTDYERRLARLGEEGNGGTASAGMARAAGAELEALEAAFERERSRFYEEGELSPAEFASQAQRSLAAAGLAIRRYRPVEGQAAKGERRLVELVVEGRAEALLSFLDGVSRSRKHRPVPSMAIRALARVGWVEATFRIGYEEIKLGGSR